MTLDLCKGTLSFQKNEEAKYTLFTDIEVGEDIEYCMGVYIWESDDCIELLPCKISK